MKLRPRLSRPFAFFLVAMAGLVALSYFPLTRIRAAGAAATILPSAGKPLVNLKNSQNVKVTYTGSADAVAALQAGTANPTALAAADFDADGAMDVVAGYSTKNGGVIALYKGNPDAFAPTDSSLYAKAMRGNVPPTFLSKAKVFAVPESPDLIVTGDFNCDGYKDVLVAARGGSLYFLAGDGHGNLLAPQPVALADQVMALAAAPDGHVAVSTDGRSGPQVTILSPSAAGLSASQTFSLPARGTSLEFGALGGGTDLAVAAGSNLVIIYGALTTNAQTETVKVPFNVQALALGDFIWDRDGRTEIAALADDGSVHILQHGKLDSRPVTAADAPTRRRASRMGAKSKHVPNPTALGAWTVAKQLAYARSAPTGPISSSAFSSPRLAASSTHDVMAIDAARSQLNILDTSGKTPSPSAGVVFSGTPVAALALPQKIDSGRDIVVLTSAQVAPMLVTSNATLTLNVNTTADIDTVNACATNSNVTTAPATLSLREAVCIANNNGATTVTINVPAGTYDLAISTFGGNDSASSSPELQVGIQSGNNITISGAGAGSTIIQQTVTGSRIIETDELLRGNMPLVIQNLSLQLGNCTDSGLDCLDNGGGAILAGSANSPLTLTNVAFNDNKATSGAGTGGGAVFYLGPTLTITGSTFNQNTASGTGGAFGGGVEVKDSVNGSQVSGSVTISNSTFTGNSASSGNNGNADGGGLFFSGDSGFTGSVTNSTFTGNTASSTASTGAATGGGIIAEGGGTDSFTVSNSRIVGNSVTASNATASGFYGLDVDGTITNDWWGCNGGPGASGCDTVVFDQSGGGTSTFTPWLVLSVSANPTQINTNATSTLTADLTHNSNNVGGFSVPNGTPVTFGGTLDSSVNPTSTALTSGQAASTYTAGSTSGNGTGTAKVDNQQVSTPVDILDSVTVTTSPGNLSITVDGVTSTAPQTFNWAVGTMHTLNTSSPQAGPSGSQYVWSSWSQGGTQSQTVSAPSSATTYTANFTTQYQLTTQASPSADGSVMPTSGGYYNSGTVVPLTATANAGYNFVNWTGNVANSNSATTSITMTAPQSVTANFSLIIVATPTTTSVSSNNNPSFTTPPGNSVTFTATVTSNTTVNEGTVTFSDPANNFTCSGGNTVPVSNGQAACTTSFTTEGANTITATYNGTVNFQGSHGSITQTTNNHTVVSGNQFCNQGAISIPNTSGAATPYPSEIFVSNLSGNISKLTVALKNIGSSNIAATDLLLVGPAGAMIVPFAHVGDASTISGVNVTLDDAASSLIPGGSPLTSGTFKPTSTTGSTSLLFPTPAPVVNAADYAATDGTATLASIFNSTAPNGTWKLFAMANSSSSAASINGGWCLNFTTSAATGTSIAVTNVSPSSEAYGKDTTVTITAVLSWTGAGSAPTASDVTIGGNGPSGYGATSCGAPSSDTMTCMASYTPSGADTVGSYTESASFSGDSNYTSSSSTQTNNFSITQATSSTSVGSSQNPSLVGQSVTFTATIGGEYGLVVRSEALPGGAVTSAKRGLTQKAQPHPLIPTSGITGNVMWSTNTGCGTTTVSGRMSQCITTTLPQGTDTITATYSGDSNHTGSVGTLAGGQVVNPAAVGTLSYPPTLDFGTVYLNSKHKLEGTIKNTGTVNVTFTGESITGAANAGTYALPKLSYCTGTPLKPGKTCTVAVNLDADAAGTLTATLNLMDNASGNPQQISLTANVIDPVAQFTNPVTHAILKTLSFGGVAVNGSKTLPVELTNVGQTALNITNVSIMGSNSTGLSANSGCGPSLAPTDSCTIQVTFAPTAKGARAGSLVVTDNVAAGKSSIPISATGK